MFCESKRNKTLSHLPNSDAIKLSSTGLYYSYGIIKCAFCKIYIANIYNIEKIIRWHNRFGCQQNKHQLNKPYPNAKFKEMDRLAEEFTELKII